MESELAKHLLTLGAVYSATRELEETTVGRFCASDGRFFSRLRDGKTFTVKKYDEVLRWFFDNWPAGTKWPKGVPQPQRTAA